MVRRANPANRWAPRGCGWVDGIVSALGALTIGAPTPAHAAPTGIRGACRLFIEREQPGPPRPEFGEFSAWTVVDNGDGSFSVGARYYAPGAMGQMRQRYTTCIIRPRGNTFALEKLSHLIR